ncbi:hypothetical protein [Flavilitoribacter nigricans]|uniref:Uncharacterized protein n=1 Tax=Flavilitoribacter nigricans (strain ATCC 23147 / DSM 23189 / NBRC 102662 / NCIMB 1420 / SS-2) TaxID=1122177 RepID=A0A2D0N3L8_FLAN2|nr:hypothetical protein [Flavilitoribacter nigricans]PHN02353.1 hypothetical protein CRP01_32430 [Flavilitoribacter nigricans DSM 23189 = NBRC 102662]
MENLMKLFLCLGVIVFLSTAPSLVPKAAAQGAEHNSFPFTVSLYNECTDENMDLSAVVNMVFKETNTASGGLHFVEHFNLQNATAVGDKGGVYTVAGSPQNYIKKCSCGNGAAVTTLETRQVFVARGSTSNLTFSFFLHITVNENGEVTSFTPGVENFKCQ